MYVVWLFERPNLKRATRFHRLLQLVLGDTPTLYYSVPWNGVGTTPTYSSTDTVVYLECTAVSVLVQQVGDPARWRMILLLIGG